MYWRVGIWLHFLVLLIDVLLYWKDILLNVSDDDGLEREVEELTIRL
jgi:hypothetical protein